MGTDPRQLGVRYNPQRAQFEFDDGHVVTEEAYTKDQGLIPPVYAQAIVNALKPGPLFKLAREEKGVKNKPKIGLDFETYGSVDLTVHGLDRYISDPNFTPLIASLYVEDARGLSANPMRLDFVLDGFQACVDQLKFTLDGNIVVAHNAPFEQAVLKWLGINHPVEDFIDSAVVARAAGAGGKLEAAAPQLLGANKMPDGWPLIKFFSMPGKYQEENNDMRFDPRIVADNPDKWRTFLEYCDLDAKLGYQIARDHMVIAFSPEELSFQALTMRMNDEGWKVDIPLVKEMQRRYFENLEVLEQEFRSRTGSDELNFNSHPQLVAWCEKRGIKSKSFDEKNCKALIKRITKRLETGSLNKAQRDAYEEVVMMLTTKLELGGSSLSKLQKILDTVGDDGRLRDQYMHCGAGQTLRTTGRDVQMQNLKRLGVPADMDTIYDDSVHWDNNQLATNLRQVFTATVPQGRLIVGDFSSVEARGLAWQGNEQWKLTAFKQNKDVYKVAAALQFNISEAAVSKSQRQFGKVGELSCGYQAGAGAVRDFAAKMDVELTEGEAAAIVSDWRKSNPNIVNYWAHLHSMLEQAVDRSTSTYKQLPDGFEISMFTMNMPASLEQLAPKSAVSIVVEIQHTHGVFLKRVFHGCHRVGNNIRYYKPTARKTGDLWTPTYTDSKTGEIRDHTIYGGKLAGILTQSFCRELFFRVLKNVQTWCDQYDNVKIVGQFHDEIVLDWQPKSTSRSVSLAVAKRRLQELMSDAGWASSFPLAAEVHSDYRYIK